MVKMPFGKYKGTPVQDLLDEDMDYFIWLTTIELRGKLKEEVDKLKEEFKKDINAYKEIRDRENDAYQDYIIMDNDWKWK